MTTFPAARAALRCAKLPATVQESASQHDAAEGVIPKSLRQKDCTAKQTIWRATARTV
jgi:hypothetical protein